MGHLRAPVRVLLVDNQPDFLESIRFWLTSKGYQVMTAKSGEQALRVIKTGRPNLVLLDIMMPEMDGIETLRRIRALSKTLPVIIVTTAFDDGNRFAGAKALGIAGLFTKSGSLTEFHRMLEGALATRRADGSTAREGALSQRWFDVVTAWLRKIRDACAGR